MVFKYKLSSRLQHGDAVELRGQAGLDRMIVDFLSDHMACDPGKQPKVIIPEDNVTEVLPVVTTQPLQIILETSGSWDVNAVSPVSSTSSHGTTAKRFGYRPGEDFFCTILVHPEHFEVHYEIQLFQFSDMQLLPDNIKALNRLLKLCCNAHCRTRQTNFPGELSTMQYIPDGLLRTAEEE